MNLSELKKLGKGVLTKLKGECIFCNIIENQEGEIVFENENVIAFAPLKRDVLAEGHTLVVPKKHYSRIFDIPSGELSEITCTAKNIADTLEQEDRLSGVNILHASGEDAQQSVKHFHLHLVPRNSEDKLDLWPDTEYEEDNYSENYEKLKEILQSRDK